ncbi:adenine phosphoribosyltransferase [Azoarcus sp. DN11]|uniref:adenine phosphoribosyltransferase n=1 Tax=Azoarcus sp. DN11 TaxID=356837 RepID=UPI000EB3B895|nr:adenine phosphoribosyltransferase [Azoarcus sp. DN11]AYH45573.1 adenine phosphoribosyltransferase [Azoarcus sp. DN11]
MSPIPVGTYIRERIRTVADWPRRGVQFRDITPLLQDRKVFRVLVDSLVDRYREADLDYVAGVDARGFILGAAVACQLNLGFIPVRKKGKLPCATLTEDYALEYGSAAMEIHSDACRSGDRVLLIDDLVATGGTLLAASKLLRRTGAEVVEAAAIIDLPALGGSERARREGIPFYAVCEFDGC